MLLQKNRGKIFYLESSVRLIWRPSGGEPVLVRVAEVFWVSTI